PVDSSASMTWQRIFSIPHSKTANSPTGPAPMIATSVTSGGVFIGFSGKGYRRSAGGWKMEGFAQAIKPGRGAGRRLAAALRARLIASAEMRFKSPLNDLEDDRQHPVDRRRRGEHLEIAVARPAKGLGEKHDLPDPHHRDQRGILQHGDELRAGRWNGDARGLRQDDLPHRDAAGQPQSGARLALALGHREDARSEDLAQIGAVVERERGDAGRYRPRHRPEL